MNLNLGAIFFLEKQNLLNREYHNLLIQCKDYELWSLNASTGLTPST